MGRSGVGLAWNGVGWGEVEWSGMEWTWATEWVGGWMVGSVRGWVSARVGG